jgi:2-polyprenyl-3-methyl-5-hydroxy-6-metoxy-1,4-benzoquinol methylase
MDSMMDIDYSIYYSKWNNDSDSHYQKMVTWYSWLLRPIMPVVDSASRILDVGCGTGLLVNALQQFGFKNVRGVDLSPTQIAVAERRGLPCAAVDAEYIHRLAQSEPATFDLIFLMDVLEHVPVGEQMRFVHTIATLLTPVGRLVLSVPNANSTFGMRWRYNDWTHHSAFTEHSLEFVLMNQGFQEVRYLPFEYAEPLRFPFVHRPSFWVGLIRGLVRALRRIEAIGELGRQGLKVPLGLNLLAVCTKVK